MLLHLLPGAVLTAFVVATAPTFERWGYPAVVALFVGIGLVIVPLELGYLLVEARRTTGRWRIGGVIQYREHLGARRYVWLGGGLALWFLVVLVASAAFVDDVIAETFFGWVPESITQFSTFEGGPEVTGARLVAVLAVAFALNGFVGPVVEELYFRGHLLPAIDRLGRRAVLLNAVLFSVYHFWTPWANVGRIVGLLPWIDAVWRTRSLRLAIVVHVTVNVVFLLLLLAVVL